MKANIHRGSKEIGGTCIELKAGKQRIILDYGLPLEEGANENGDPEVKGIKKGDPSILGVFISHPHLDHYGKMHDINPSIPVFMGESARNIITTANQLTAGTIPIREVKPLVNRQKIHLGSFTITPLLIDHSAYQSFSFLVEAKGRRLFYTGDFRGHGRKSGLFEKILKNPPKNINTLLLEGTNINDELSEQPQTREQELEKEFERLIKNTRGLVLGMMSGQNIDRLVTVYKAVRRSNRQLILDLYTAQILKSLNNPKIPQAGWPGIKVYLPANQQRVIKTKKLFELTAFYRPFRIYKSNLLKEAKKSVLLFRPSMSTDLTEPGLFEDSLLIYSMWEGYLEKESMAGFRNWMRTKNIPLTHCHTSGHASITDLKRLVKAIAPNKIIPIHTARPDLYRQIFKRVKKKKDGCWWKI